MATNLHQLNPGAKRFATIVKHDSVCVHAAHQRDNILDVISVPKQALTHVSPTGVIHFAILNMKLGIG